MNVEAHDWVSSDPMPFKQSEQRILIPHARAHWNVPATSWFVGQDARPPSLSPPNSSSDELPRFTFDHVDSLGSKLFSVSEEEMTTSTPQLSPSYAPPSPPKNCSNSDNRSRLSVDTRGRVFRHPAQNRLLSPHSSDDLTKTSDDSKDSNPRFKTEICRNFKEKGSCLYGVDCQFAHGNEEMRETGKQNKYKTKLCQKYWIAGYCAYGPRCNFVHNEDKDNEARRRPGSAGDLSGESLEWASSNSYSPGNQKIPPLVDLFRPEHGSGRLAAFLDNDSLTWVDTWTKRIV